MRLVTLPAYLRDVAALPGLAQRLKTTRAHGHVTNVGVCVRVRACAQVPVVCALGGLWVRISAQIYNTPADYQALGAALAGLAAPPAAAEAVTAPPAAAAAEAAAAGGRVGGEVRQDGPRAAREGPNGKGRAA
jgi:hypothetical protein